MSLNELLLQRRKIVLQTWLDLLLSTYPPETVRLLKKETDQFANPVGHTFSVALGKFSTNFSMKTAPKNWLPCWTELSESGRSRSFPRRRPWHSSFP